MDVQCLFQNSRQIEHGFTFIFHELHNITLCFHILVIHTVIPYTHTNTQDVSLSYLRNINIL